ncbi:ATP-binding protein [Kitasatospora sp. CB02891]|uniref:ATP-binding protein n=1 Tax=Kitasatospora sp. CB02891 TaxID=2020329 RepID=UPI0012FDE4C2|nr:ATP-binding protein [Kitasatospora sp. CB02891]
MDTRTDLAPLPPLVPGTLLVAVGPGASGKSTFAARAGVAVLGLDALREEIGGDPGEQSVTPAAVELQNARLEEYLRAGTLVLLDSTNVETRVRAELVERARRHSRPAVALRFVPGLDICLERNRLRPANRRIPDDVLRWQHELAREATAEVLLGEGFTAVHQITPAPAAAR